MFERCGWQDLHTKLHMDFEVLWRESAYYYNVASSIPRVEVSLNKILNQCMNLRIAVSRFGQMA